MSAEVVKLRGRFCDLCQKNEPLKLSYLLCQGKSVAERYELINCEEGYYPVSSMCRWSTVSGSGSYFWCDQS